MLKLAKADNKYIVSGFKDESQAKNLIKVGFKNRVFEVFDTLEEAEKFISG